MLPKTPFHKARRWNFEDVKTAELLIIISLPDLTKGCSLLCRIWSSVAFQNPPLCVGTIYGYMSPFASMPCSSTMIMNTIVNDLSFLMWLSSA